MTHLITASEWLIRITWNPTVKKTTFKLCLAATCLHILMIYKYFVFNNAPAPSLQLLNSLGIFTTFIWKTLHNGKRNYITSFYSFPRFIHSSLLI